MNSLNLADLQNPESLAFQTALGTGCVLCHAKPGVDCTPLTATSGPRFVHVARATTDKKQGAR